MPKKSVFVNVKEDITTQEMNRLKNTMIKIAGNFFIVPTILALYET